MEPAPEFLPGKFSKYEKMGETSGAVGAAVGSGRYVVTEKVHGANFCIIAAFAGDGVEVSFAKRTAVIGQAVDAEDFYSCRSTGLLRALEPMGEAVLRQLASEGGLYPEAAAVHIYGELFGGRYPHPDVPAVKGLEPVQIGVWYAPDLHFMAFDVAVERAGQRVYMDLDQARNVCCHGGLLFARPLLEGTLAECLDFGVEFETTVPEQLGYPSLPSASGAPRNLAEGVVIRPQKEPAKRLGAAAGRKESARGLFKVKIEAFSEKRYQNDNWKKGKAGGSGMAPSITDAEECRYEVLASITEARLAAVISKIGRVDPHNREACRELLAEFKEDVHESLEDQHAESLRSSEELQQELDRLSRELITRELVGQRSRVKLGKGSQAGC